MTYSMILEYIALLGIQWEGMRVTCNGRHEQGKRARSKKVCKEICHINFDKEKRHLTVDM